jgi:DNA-binding Lrp family transcriptional regulator
MRSARLDATDWRILRELQADGRITNVDLARKVGISAPPCLRRTRALATRAAAKRKGRFISRSYLACP